jgi:L-xylulokinase
VWCRMFADITGLAIEAARASQAGALGVAVCAAVGTGAFGGFAEAVGQMVGEGKTYTPNPGVRETYQRKYDKFSRIIDTLDAGE